MKHILTLSLYLAFSFSVAANTKSIDVIYGEDNRKDVYASTDSVLVELSKSTAAMIEMTNLQTQSNGDIVIQAETLKSRGICEKERFSNQISAANCSGFLVAPNVLVTAGHCIKTEQDCASYKWVFDYKVDHADQAAITVSKQDVFSCKRIIARSLDQMSKDDWAVIELDRKSDRKPLIVRKKGKITTGTSIAVIGHPTGLPTKIADGAKVRSLATKFFQANLDTYGGNSGSAVFNTKTGEVEGILVRGENDYVYDSALGCQVSNYCPDTGCRGEDVTYITNVKGLSSLK